MGLKGRDVVEGEAEKRKPVNKPITGKPAQRMQLIKTWAEGLLSEGAVEGVRNVSQAVLRPERCPRHIGQRKPACRQNSTNRIGKRQRATRGGAWHGPVVQHEAAEIRGISLE